MCPSGYTGVTYYGLEPGSIGLTLDKEGRPRRLRTWRPSCLAADCRCGKITLADRFEGKRLNSPNDLCFDSTGALYFTDPPYGLPQRAMILVANSISVASFAWRPMVN